MLKRVAAAVDHRQVGDEYFVEWQGDLRANAAGASARRKAAELRAARSWTGALVDGLTGRRDDGWSWTRGAEGEEAVARILAPLPASHWRVLHDLPIGHRGANVDHLVIGSPGVFTINTKHLTGRVEVTRDAVRRNDRQTRFVDAAVTEARRVRAVLEHRTGEAVEVEPLVVVLGAEVQARSQPRDATVLVAGDLVRWLSALPQALTFEQWQARCRAATAPATWTAPEPRAAERVETAAGPVAVRRWRRHGHDRLYVATLAGDELGWSDLRTGDVHVSTATSSEVVRQATRPAVTPSRRSAPSPTPIRSSSGRRCRTTWTPDACGWSSSPTSCRTRWCD